MDLRDTVAIESAGVRALIDAMSALRELGGALVIQPPSGGVYELGRAKRLGELVAAANDAVEEADAIHRLDQLFS